jgi:hypothetical protein
MTEITQGVVLGQVLHMIAAGECPEVSNAFYSRGRVSLGTLGLLDLVEKRQTHCGRMTICQWEYLPSAPGPIKIDGEIWHPGHLDEPYEMDYS